MVVSIISMQLKIFILNKIAWNGLQIGHFSNIIIIWLALVEITELQTKNHKEFFNIFANIFTKIFRWKLYYSVTRFLKNNANNSDRAEFLAPVRSIYNTHRG